MRECTRRELPSLAFFLAGLTCEGIDSNRGEVDGTHGLPTAALPGVFLVSMMVPAKRAALHIDLPGFRMIHMHEINS